MAITGYFKYNKKIEVNQEAYNPTSGSNTAQAKELNYDNLDDFLKGLIANKLPDNFVAVFRTYNFNSGEREWERSFTLTKDSVVEGFPDKYDLLIIMSSKYLDGLNTANFCGKVQTAKASGDFGIEYSVNEIELAWKLKSLSDLKSCFGI